MKNELFAIPFSSSRPQRKLVTYYLYCYQRKPFEKVQKEQQKNDRLAVKKRAEPER